MIHVIRPGESLSKIASQYRHLGINSYREIYDAKENASFRARNRNPNKVSVGSKLHIPLVEIKFQGRSYWGTPAHAKKLAEVALEKFKNTELKKAKLAIEGSWATYEVLWDLINSDLFVSWTLDLFSRKRDLSPSDNSIKKAENALKDLEQAIATRNWKDIERLAQRVQTLANAANNTFKDAMRGLSGASDTAVTTLEITKTTSFAIVGLYATLVTGGTITAAGSTAGATAMSSTAQLGIPALLSMVETSADEGGKALAGNKHQTKTSVAANIFTAGLASVAVDKFFGSPKAKKFFGELAYEMNGALNVDHLGIKLANGTFKDLLEVYMTSAGKATTQEAIVGTVKAANGEANTRQIAQAMAGKAGSGVQTKFMERFVTWLIESGKAIK